MHRSRRSTRTIIKLSPNNAVSDTIFDRLVNTDDRARMIPGLATEWRTVEPTVVGVQLRSNVLPQRQRLHRR